MNTARHLEQDDGSSVTLVYTRRKEIWKEAALNLLASAATGSPFTHCEIAIGEAAPPLEHARARRVWPTPRMRTLAGARSEG